MDFEKEKLEKQLNGLTKAALIKKAQEYNLYHLNDSFKPKYIIDEIIVAAEEIARSEKIAKASINAKSKSIRPKDKPLFKDGISFKSPKYLEDYLLNISNIRGLDSSEEAELLQLSSRGADIIRRKMDAVKKTQEGIINELESQGCLLHLLSKNELQEYCRNIGIELSLKEDKYDLICQIELADNISLAAESGTEYTISKRYRKTYLKKLKYVDKVKRKLDEIKVSQENNKEELKSIEQRIKIINQRKEEEELVEAAEKYRKKKEVEATNVKREAAKKAKEILRKSFF